MFIIKVVGKEGWTNALSAIHFYIYDSSVRVWHSADEVAFVEYDLAGIDTIYIMDAKGNTLDTITHTD